MPSAKKVLAKPTAQKMSTAMRVGSIRLSHAHWVVWESIGGIEWLRAELDKRAQSTQV